jgi:hypothetical protein
MSPIIVRTVKKVQTKTILLPGRRPIPPKLGLTANKPPLRVSSSGVATSTVGDKAYVRPSLDSLDHDMGILAERIRQLKDLGADVTKMNFAPPVKKEKKNPNKYIRWYSTHRKEFVKQNPALRQGPLAKLMAQKWKDMSQTEKDSWANPTRPAK